MASSTKIRILVSCSILVAAGCQFSSTGQNAQGVALFEQGQTNAAIFRFQQALSSDPRNPDSYYNLAATYHAIGRQRSDDNMLKQAENLYHQCLDLHADHAACHRGLAVLLVDSGRPKSAFTLLERWADRSANPAEAKIELARLHDEYGEIELAQRYLTEAIDANPQNSRAWLALGSIRENQGNLAQAVANYQQAMQLNRSQPAVAQKIASLQRSIATGSPASSNGTRMVQRDDWRRR